MGYTRKKHRELYQIFYFHSVVVSQCISWTIKYLILLMHGATKKIENSSQRTWRNDTTLDP